MNKVEVFSTQKRFDYLAKEASLVAQRVFLLLKKDGFWVDIHLISDKKIKELNQKYRKKNKATNVLSFPHPKDFVLPPDKKNYKYLGEIFVAPEYIKKHNQDIYLMIVHGLLHLFGYDHIKKQDRQKMERKEAYILARL